MTDTYCQCLDCGWRGPESALKAQACPVCDGRVADIPKPAEPSDLLRGLVVSRISEDDGCMFIVPSATLYGVTIRNRMTDVETSHTFNSMTARALFIIANEEWSDIQREWIA